MSKRPTWFLALALVAACDTGAIVSAPGKQPPETAPQVNDTVSSALPPHPDSIRSMSLDTVDARCPAPRRLLPQFAPDSRIVKALRNGDPVTIVAIGSSSTQGVGASSMETTYPGQIQRMMTRQWPRSNVRVINSGVGSNTVEHIVARFEHDVYAHNPDAVILQTGTIEAMNRYDMTWFMRTFRDGVARLRARGYEVWIMDSQLYPGEGQTASYAAYQDSMTAVASAGSLPVIRRFDMMKLYVESERYTLRQLLWNDNFHPSELTYECVARYVTRGLERATAP